MGFLLGENVNIGLGTESLAARGTAVSPTVWVGGRTPTGVHQIVDKVPVRETRAGRIASQAAEMIMKRAEGDLEFNVRNSSIGQILYALFGSVSTSTLESGVYQHAFSVLATSPQHPTLTLALAQAGSFQDYKYANAIVRSLELRTPVNDLVNATVNFLAKSEATNSAYSPSFPSTDYAFRHYDVTFKLATNLAGLGAASAIKPKEFSLSINNNARPNQNIGELNPSDILAMVFEIAGTLKMDYQDETYHDLVSNNTERAMRITLSRSDVTLGTVNNPTVEIDLAKVTFDSYNPDRPIDDIVQEELPFTAHYSDADAKAITARIVNGTSAIIVA